MYCSHCGAHLQDGAVYCPVCGTKCDVSVHHNQVLNDEPHILVNILCFFIPILALFLFLVWLKTYPEKSKAAAKWGIIGILANVCLTIFIYVFLMFRMFF